MVTEEQIIEVLKQCMDPEIPVDVWNLGLVYNIGIENSNASSKQDVAITMTLTTPGCGMIEHIKNDVKTKIEALEEVNQATITMTFDPRWNSNMISSEARKILNL